MNRSNLSAHFMLRTWLAAILGLALPAGSWAVITNTAAVTFTDAVGTPYTQTSNAATTTVNLAPTANPQSVTTLEDTAKAITLVGTDPEGQPLTYAIVTQPTHGTLSVVSGANVTYTPAANYNGPDSFTFKVNDGAQNSNIATVSITVTAVNDAPVATPQPVTTAEDTAKVITLAGTDVEGSPLTFAIVTQPTHGTLSVVSGANVTYTPAANYNGPDSFTFTANDGALTSAAATVSITVTAVNDAPTASFTATPTSGNAPLVVSFDASASSDIDGTITSYAWAFGDTASGTGVTTSHTYSAAGTYTAVLTVTDNSGAPGTFSRVISVGTMPVPNIVLTKNVDLATAISGATLTYTITYQNTGAGNATNVVIKDVIPAGSTYVAGSASNAGAFASGTITWNIGTVNAGAAAQTVSFQAKVQ